MAKRRDGDVHIAVLRGVNVGGKHRLPMAALREIFEKAGCSEVRTYIQSGNVVYAAGPSLATRVPSAVATEIARRHGFQAPVVTRSAAEWAQAIAASPFEAVDTAQLHLGFMAAAPAPTAVASLDPERSPGDAFAVRGREIHLCLASGMARTKLTNAWFDGRLDTSVTFRNWSTVLALHALARG